MAFQRRPRRSMEYRYGEDDLPAGDIGPRNSFIEDPEHRSPFPGGKLGNVLTVLSAIAGGPMPNADIGPRMTFGPPSGDERLSGEGGAEMAGNIPQAPQATITGDIGPRPGTEDPLEAMNSQAYGIQDNPDALANDGRLMTPTEERLNEALDSYTEAINRKPTDKNGRGKSILKGLAYGASKAFDRPARDMNELAYGLGSAAGGGIGGAIHPQFDEELDQQKDIGSRGEYLKAAQTNANIQSNVDSRQARSEYQRGTLDLNKEKEENRKRYQEDKLQLGKDIADKNFEYRNQIVELRRRGVDQNDARIQQIQQRIDESIRHNKTTEGQRDKEIGIKLTTADLQKRRTAAYEQSVKRGAKPAEAKVAQDQAEAQFWTEAADDYDKKAKEAEDGGNTKAAQQMRARANAAREKGGRLGARAGAVK